MSNLNSVFDTRRGYPYGSALERSFEPTAGVSMPEGTIVALTGRRLANAAVLRIVTDAAGGGSPPTLLAADKGKAYVVNTWGAGYNDGDIVEWDGAQFVVIVANDGGLCADGTRAVVVESGAAGSFAGNENHVYVYTQDPGPPAVGAWTIADHPAATKQIRITAGNGSVYAGKYYDYSGTAWVKSTRQVAAPPILAKLTSGTKASSQKDDAWVVIQGNDQWDASFVNKATCLKLRSGCSIKIAHTAANTLVPGTVLQANDGALEAYTSKWPVGVVIWSNGTAGAEGKITFASY